MNLGQSEVARKREEIRLREEAAQRAFSAPAIVASHEMITRRMELGATRVLALKAAGKHQEAETLFLSDDLWNVEQSVSQYAAQGDEQ